jgi:hypothetical protein
MKNMRSKEGESKILGVKTLVSTNLSCKEIFYPPISNDD